MSGNFSKQKRLSVPSNGQTLLGNARIWGIPILTAHQRLTNLLGQKISLSDCIKIYYSDYDFLNYAYPKSNYQTLTFELCSAALILNWIVGRTLRSLSNDASLTEAEYWYRGTKTSSQQPISKSLDLFEQASVLEPLRSLEYDAKLVDILPYAAEVFETSEELLEAFGQKRKLKRNSGVFYTPSDLSDYIVQQVYNSFCFLQANRNPTWLDPACGTGIFLRSAFHCVINNNSQVDTSRYLFDNLFGIDVSPIALQTAAYCLILTYGHICSTDLLQTPKSALESIGSHLVVCDSTTIQDRQKLSELLPSLSNGADCVVSNPPYIRKPIAQTRQLSLFDNSNLHTQTASRAIYIDFVRMLDRLSNSTYGAGGIVIPLSIAYSSRREFQQLRQFLSAHGDVWRFAHFDRTPDSLFGDDVKIRCTIALFERSPEKFYCTTRLMRWNSRTRNKLFDGIKFAKLFTNIPIQGIPKVGSNFEVNLLEAIANNCIGRLGDTVKRTKSLSLDIRRYLRNSRTAYNWLPFELLSANSFDKRYSYWIAKSEIESLITFALVESRLSYWLWRVWGDGFHLTDQFIISLPFSINGMSDQVRNRLALLGKNLWKEMRSNELVSVNSGIKSTSFDPYSAEHIIDEIDTLIITEYQFPEDTLLFLKNFVRDTILAGRDSEIDSNIALQRWAKGGTNGKSFKGN